MAPPGLSRALYAALMQTVRTIGRSGEPLRVRIPVRDGRVQWLSDGAPQSEFVRDPPTAALEALFPYASSALFPSGEVTASALKGAIRDLFRQPVSDPADADARVNQGFAALRALHEQIAMARTSSVATSEPFDDVRVTVEATSSYRGTATPPGETAPLFFFQYRVRICNEGASAVRLLGRQWTIYNDDGSTHASVRASSAMDRRDIRRDLRASHLAHISAASPLPQVPRGSSGVVGRTPVLKPSEAFEYSSGTTLTQAMTTSAGPRGVRLTD